MKITKYSEDFIKDMVDPSPALNGTLLYKDNIYFKCRNGHPNYLQNVRTHVRGSGCPLCGQQRRIAVVRKRSLLDPSFLNDLVNKEPAINGTLKTTDKVYFKCHKGHGDYLQRVSSHLDGCGCIKCSSEIWVPVRSKKYRDKNPYPDWFIDDIVDKSLLPTLAIRDYVYFKCHNGHPNYLQLVGSHLQGTGCPLCYNEYRRKSPFPESFINDLVDPEATLLMNLHTRSKTYFKCHNGHPDYLQIVNNHLRGQGCPICGMLELGCKASKRQRSLKPYSESFINDLVDPEAALTGKLRINSKVYFKCCKGHPNYLQSVETHMYGSGCPICAKLLSKPEQDIADYFKSLGIKVITRTRDVIKSPHTNYSIDLDIYFPDHNLAVEYNGIYWHSTAYRKDALKLHLMKTTLCENKGIQLIHVFEDDYRDKKEIVLNMLKSKLGLLQRKSIGARKTDIRVVSQQQASDFLNKHHIQGKALGRHYGLYYEDNLVSMITVRKLPNNSCDIGCHLLDRYASVPELFVIGGFDKLLRYAEKQENIIKWISFADRTISQGSLYINSGWIKDKIIRPDYKYVYGNYRVHKFNFRLKNFKYGKKFKYIEGMTERKLAELNNIPRIYDCGKIKFYKTVC